MEKRSSIEKQSVSSRTNSSKDLSTTHSHAASVKSNKSVDNQTNQVTSNSVSKSVIIEQEQDSVIHNINKGQIQNIENKIKTVPLDGTTKIPHKFITNWRLACDRTKDRTRELLKRWKTLSEFEGIEQAQHVANANKSALACKENMDKNSQNDKSGWSVHVWTTWVDRFSVDDASEDPDSDDLTQIHLTEVQKDKFSNFFIYLLDHDRDDIISDQDFEAFIERLRHFADWSPNSPEFHILREVQQGFIDTFLAINEDEHQFAGFELNCSRFISLEIWLHRWERLLSGARKMSDFPLWLQYFVRVLFQIINRSGSGIISRDELSAFYSSVMCLDTVKVGAILDHAYQNMTSNGDHQLGFHTYKLCFANYLMARHPNGPGQYIFGVGNIDTTGLFPVDYSALNTDPDDLEQYTPHKQTNRHSVMV